MKKYSLPVVLALLVAVAHAQYNWTYSLSLADNTPWCATINCLTSVGGTNSELKAGFDGTVYGLTSTHVLYTYTKASGWVQAASGLQTAGGLSIIHISVGSASEVLAINSAASPTANVYVLNSAGTGWTLLGGQWLSTAEIGPDGSVWGVRLSTAKLYNWNGSIWLLDTGTLSNLAVGSARSVWGVNSSGTLYYWNGTAMAAMSPAPPFTPSHAYNAIAAVGETSLSLIDTSGGIHLSADAGQTWHTVLGTAAAITGGGATMFVRNSSGVSYHVNLVVPAITDTGTGSYSCNGIQGCSTATHTLSSRAWFGGNGGAHGTGGTVGVMSGSPPTFLTGVATEFGSLCDLFFGDPLALECGGDVSGIATCSVMGTVGEQIATAVTLNTQVEGALTQAYWNGAPVPSCSKLCSYAVHNNCTVATTPPDLNMAAVESGNYVGIATYISWMNAAVCIRFFGPGSPWACTPALSFINSMNVAMPPYVCTHNP